jgi:hypothetical protein
MNAYGMELYAEIRLEQAREDAATRRLLKAARAGTEPPWWLRRWLRLDPRRCGRPPGSARGKRPDERVLTAARRGGP